MKFKITDCHRSNGTVWSRVGIPPKMSTQEFNTILTWCREKFGTNSRYINEDNVRWSISMDERSNLFFKNSEDVTLFLMRWA